MLVNRFDIKSVSNFLLMRKTRTFNKGISVDEKELVNQFDRPQATQILFKVVQFVFIMGAEKKYVILRGE